MTQTTQFFDICIVIRDRFIKEYEKAKKAYEEKSQEIQRDYKNERARAESQANKERFERAKEEAAERLKKDLEAEFIKAEAVEQAKVSAVKIGADTLRALDGLSGVPVSAEEFSLLAKGCEGSGYWVTKRLKMIAEQNGILAGEGLEASYSEKMAALTEAKTRLEEYSLHYDPEKFFVGVDDRAIRRLESQFSNGYINYNVSPEKRAALLLDDVVKCGDVMTAAVRVRNLLQTVTDEKVKAEICKTLESDSSFWRNVSEFGGLTSLLSAYTKERKQTEKEALKITKDARDAATVARLSEAEKKAALWGASISPDNAGSERKIDKQGLAFLETEAGKAKIKEFERIAEKTAAYISDKKAEAERREQIEG